MGAFCVYGISRQACRKKAEKTAPTKVYDVLTGRQRELSVAEWGERVRAAGDEAFELAVTSDSKVAKISPEFDAPQFCRDWISASPTEVARTKIMYRGEKVDKHGAVVMRNGAPVLTWLEYDEKQAWPRPFGEGARIAATESACEAMAA